MYVRSHNLTTCLNKSTGWIYYLMVSTSNNIYFVENIIIHEWLSTERERNIRNYILDFNCDCAIYWKENWLFAWNVDSKMDKQYLLINTSLYLGIAWFNFQDLFSKNCNNFAKLASTQHYIGINYSMRTYL
jgi:hypothetical protein